MQNKFIEWAEKEGWNTVSDSSKSTLPDSIVHRYRIPPEWLAFIENLAICEDASAETWFLTPDDYSEKADGFQWNEFERQSLEAAGSDENLKAEITSYWNTHLPIILSVKDGYSYYAINVENGNVVVGYEPEYEESDVAAADFYEFIERVIAGEIVL